MEVHRLLMRWMYNAYRIGLTDGLVGLPYNFGDAPEFQNICCEGMRRVLLGTKEYREQTKVRFKHQGHSTQMEVYCRSCGTVLGEGP